MRHSQILFALIFAAISAVSAHGQTTLFSTGFEPTETPAYAVGQNLKGYNGWSQTPGPTGSAFIENIDPQTGTQYVRLATSNPVMPDGTEPFYYPDLSAPLATALASGQTTITSSAAFAMDIGGNGSVLTLQIVDPASFSMGGIATMDLIYDPNFAADHFAAAFSVQIGYNDGYIFPDGLGHLYYGYVYQDVSLGLPDNTFATGKDLYSNFSIVDDLASQELTFKLNGVTLATAPAYSNTFENAFVGGGIINTGDPTAIDEIDNYSVTAVSPAPEPGVISLFALGSLGLLFLLRRKANA